MENLISNNYTQYFHSDVIADGFYKVQTLGLKDSHVKSILANALFGTATYVA